MIGQAAMRPVLDELERAETRLRRLLAAGWRDTAAEIAALAGIAGTLDALGLTEAAALIRAIASAASPTDALRAIALAAAACRMLSVRIGTDDLPPGEWRPLADATRRTPPAPDRLIPLCRMAFGDRELWSCLCLRGYAVEWVLVDPPRIDLPRTTRPRVPWLLPNLAGHLRWTGRFPLGAGRDIQVCALSHAAWEEPEAAVNNPFDACRTELVAGKLRKNRIVLYGPGKLRTSLLERDRLDDYAWPDAALRDLLAEANLGAAWVLVWEQDAVPSIVAVLTVGGLPRKTRIVHLMPGCPAEAVDASR